jgi:hypothetical protein
VKKLKQLTEYSECLAGGLSVRRAAARVGVHPSTAFRWRHALLDGLLNSELDRLAGWIEFDWVLVAYSQKGQRGLGDRARRRGVRHGRRTQLLRVSVWAACDRRGRTANGVCVSYRPWTRAVESDLDSCIQGPVMLTDLHGPMGPAATYAHRRQGRFHDARATTRAAVQVLLGVDFATNYLRRFQIWVRRFRGVATKYLDNYLRWHLIWDREYRQGLSATLLQWCDRIVSTALEPSGLEPFLLELGTTAEKQI